MGSSEPSLVPEWLRCNGSATRSFRTSYHPASSNSRTDAASLANYSRNKSFRSSGEFEAPRTLLDRSSSTNSGRSSGSISNSNHAYSSFNRGHRDKDQKERSAFGEFRDRGSYDRLGRDTLRRSSSMVSRKQEELFPWRVASDTTDSEKGNHSNGNSYHDGDRLDKGVKKEIFEKDFPMLQADENQGVPPITRVPSPVLTVTSQGLPIGSSSSVGEGWSALAEVPAKNPESPHTHQAADTSSASETSSPVAGLNMAEALAQSQVITRTEPQISADAHKLEQMAIKQSRQLVPMTPVMPKFSVVKSADKLKPKTATKNGELISRTGLHSQPLSSSHLASQSLRGAHVGPEPLKTSQVGKFHVLKRPFDSGTTPATKDGTALANNVGNIQPPNTLVTSVGSATSLRTSNNSRASIVERKVVGLSPYGPASVEKKVISSHARSRHAFFNSMRNKTSMNMSIYSEAISTTSSSSFVEQPSEVDKDTGIASLNGHSLCNGVSAEEAQKLPTGESHLVSVNEVIPNEEEEAAFLRSLGWEENGDEDDMLTEDEINNFYQELMKLRPTLNLCEATQQPNMSLLHALSVGGGLSRLASSEAVCKLN